MLHLAEQLPRLDKSPEVDWQSSEAAGNTILQSLDANEKYYQPNIPVDRDWLTAAFVRFQPAPYLQR